MEIKKKKKDEEKKTKSKKGDGKDSIWMIKQVEFHNWNDEYFLVSITIQRLNDYVIQIETLAHITQVTNLGDYRCRLVLFLSVVVTVINVVSMRATMLVQDVMAFCKFLALGLIIVYGMIELGKGGSEVVY